MKVNLFLKKRKNKIRKNKKILLPGQKVDCLMTRVAFSSRT
jgi:hypothetical protein